MNTSYKIKPISIISSVGKTLLVACLVLILGWTLIQVAKRQNLTLTPIHMTRKGVMNFVSLKLTPSKKAKPDKSDAGDGL